MNLVMNYGDTLLDCSLSLQYRHLCCLAYLNYLSVELYTCIWIISFVYANILDSLAFWGIRMFYLPIFSSFYICELWRSLRYLIPRLYFVTLIGGNFLMRIPAATWQIILLNNGLEGIDLSSAPIDHPDGSYTIKLTPAQFQKFQANQARPQKPSGGDDSISVNQDPSMLCLHSACPGLHF